MWENLELTKKSRARRKTLTLWVTMAFLGASFAFLYASNIAEREYNAAGKEFFTDTISMHSRQGRERGSEGGRELVVRLWKFSVE